MTRRPGGGVGALVLLILLALCTAGCGLSLQSLPKPGGVSGPTYQLRAVFANVLNLPLQARVLVGANEVGQVTAISTAHYKADLTLTIRRDVRLGRGTTAQILFDSPLGDEFIELNPASGGAHGRWLTNGATLPEQDTDSAPSIADTLAALGALLNGGGLNQLQTIVSQLNDALRGHQPQIRAILTDIETTVASLNANRSSIDSALSGLAQLSGELSQGSTTIANGIDAIGPAVAVLVRENGEFSQLLTSTGHLSTVASSIVDASGQDTVAAIQQLDAVVNQVVGVEQQLGPTLRDFARFEQLTKKIAPGDYLQLSLTGTVVVSPSTVTGSIGQLAGPDGSPGSGPSTTNAQAIAGLLGAGLP